MTVLPTPPAHSWNAAGVKLGLRPQWWSTATSKKLQELFWTATCYSMPRWWNLRSPFRRSKSRKTQGSRAPELLWMASVFLTTVLCRMSLRSLKWSLRLLSLLSFPDGLVPQSALLQCDKTGELDILLWVWAQLQIRLLLHTLRVFKLLSLKPISCHPGDLTPLRCEG